MRTLIKMQFDPQIAKELGVEEAIMYSNIEYWVEKNKANNKNFYDNHYWTYNSITAFENLFNFWTKRQIERILKNLENKGFLKIGNYNKHKYDRTKWYTSISPNREMEITECVDVNNQTEKPIPNNKPDNKPIPKGIQKAEYGNNLVNRILETVKNFTGLNTLDDTIGKNRQYAYLLYKNKIKPEFINRQGVEPTDEQIIYSLQAILNNSDNFHKKNITNIKYIYYNFGKLISQNVGGNIKII